MTQQDQDTTSEQCAQEMIRQERVIYTVAADLLMMNKMLEEDKKKEPQQPRSFFHRLFQSIRSKFKT